MFAVGDLGMFFGEFAQKFAGSVGGTVVDDDEFAQKRRWEVGA